MKQLKRLLALILVLASCFSVLPAETWAAQVPDHTAQQTETEARCGDQLLWTLTQDGVLTISGKGAMYDYSLQEGSQSPWYLQGIQGKISKIVIENGVTGVGSYAFFGCKGLTQVLLADSIKSIGPWAFGGCSALKQVTVPASVDKIQEYAFGYYQGESVGILSGLILAGYSNSAAQSYAEANSHVGFQTLDEKPVRLNAPTVLKADLTVDGVKVQWSRCEGAEKYRVFYKTGSGAWVAAKEDTSSTWFTVKGLKSGTKYTFTVACLASDGTLVSDYGKSSRSAVYIAAPVVKSVNVVSGGVQVSWNKVTGAAQYRVYYKTGSGGWKRAGDTGKTSFTVKNLTPGKTYSFTVRCLSANGKAYTSAYDAKGKSTVYLATPTIKSVSNTVNGIQVGWNKVSGAQKYRVFYKTGSGSWTKAGDTGSTSFLIKGLKNNQKYTVTVRCVTGDGSRYVSYYHTAGKSLTFFNAPTLKNAVSVNNGVNVTWTKVPGIAKYRVFYKTGSGGWKKAGDTAKNAFLVTGLTSGKSYIFTVRGLSSDGRVYTSGYHAKGVSAVYVAAPKLNGAEILDDGIKVSWSKIDGATNYRVFYKTNNSSWVRLEDTAETELVINDLDPEEAYTFTVRCLSADGKRYISGYNAKGISTARYLTHSPAQYNFTSPYRNGPYYDKLMSVRLTDNARDNIVAVAMSQLGYHEGRVSSSTDGTGNGYDMSNYTEFGRWYYNHVDSSDVFYKGAWCSMFVSWCANEAGISSGTVPRRALVAYMSNAFQSMGRYYTWNQTKCGYGSKNIQKGDLIFYSSAPGSRLSHIGIVTDVTYKDNKAYISTVEGNFDDACRTRRFIMTKGSNGKIDSEHYIRGFACPNY